MSIQMDFHPILPSDTSRIFSSRVSVRYPVHLRVGAFKQKRHTVRFHAHLTLTDELPKHYNTKEYGVMIRYDGSEAGEIQGVRAQQAVIPFVQGVRGVHRPDWLSLAITPMIRLRLPSMETPVRLYLVRLPMESSSSLPYHVVTYNDQIIFTPIRTRDPDTLLWNQCVDWTQRAVRRFAVK